MVLMSSGLPPRAAQRFWEMTTAAMTPRAMHSPYIRSVSGPISRAWNPGLGREARAANGVSTLTGLAQRQSNGSPEHGRPVRTGSVERVARDLGPAVVRGQHEAVA